MPEREPCPGCGRRRTAAPAPRLTSVRLDDMADRVLKLEVGNAVLLGDDRQFLTCSEQRERVLKPRSPVGEDRLSEGAADIATRCACSKPGSGSAVANP